MSSLARRIAPAAALGGVAIAIVGVLDPALAGTTEAGTTEAQAAGTEAAAPAPSGCDAAPEVAGPASMTPWGPVQVVATVADGTLCDVHAVAYPSNDRKSQQINSYAIPALDAVAAEQGVAFDSVSGATYTSQAYRDSLQQLLDSL